MAPGVPGAVLAGLRGADLHQRSKVKSQGQVQGQSPARTHSDIHSIRSSLADWQQIRDDLLKKENKNSAVS